MAWPTNPLLQAGQSLCTDVVDRPPASLTDAAHRVLDGLRCSEDPRTIILSDAWRIRYVCEGASANLKGERPTTGQTASIMPLTVDHYPLRRNLLLGRGIATIRNLFVAVVLGVPLLTVGAPLSLLQWVFSPITSRLSRVHQYVQTHQPQYHLRPTSYGHSLIRLAHWLSRDSLVSDNQTQVSIKYRSLGILPISLPRLITCIGFDTGNHTHTYRVPPPSFAPILRFSGVLSPLNTIPRLVFLVLGIFADMKNLACALLSYPVWTLGFAIASIHRAGGYFFPRT